MNEHGTCDPNPAGALKEFRELLMKDVATILTSRRRQQYRWPVVRAIHHKGIAHSCVWYRPAKYVKRLTNLEVSDILLARSFKYIASPPSPTTLRHYKNVWWAKSTSC